MTEAEIDAALGRAEAAVERGEGLQDTGFWKAVSEVKRTPELVDRFAPRIADIDRRAFEQWALMTLPYGTGLGIMAAATAAGTTAIAFSSRLRAPANWLVFGTGTAAVLVASHSVGHLIVGKAMGIRFTHWFVGQATQPQPGVKVDYDSYLRTSARHRALMHAAGALVTKVMAFVAIPVARLTGQPRWVRRLVTAFAFGAVTTDLLWSVHKSDWKKVKRELGYSG
ncbi:MAG TPA: hypothetical protein VHL52_10985 [Acidimicrobiia bacterium]|nr:hypothetical protein [Acidimicrobiia bacterium]